MIENANEQQTKEATRHPTQQLNILNSLYATEYTEQIIISSLIEYLRDYEPNEIQGINPTQDGSKPVSKQIKAKQQYYLEGTVNGSKREGNPPNKRNNIIVDIELSDEALSNSEHLYIDDVLDSVLENLSEYEYYLHTTINHQDEFSRIRVILPTEESMNEQQYKATASFIINKLDDLPIDKEASTTFSKLMGFPVKTDLDNFHAEHNDGKSVPIVNNSLSENVAGGSSPPIQVIPHTHFIKAMQLVAKHDYDNLLEEEHYYKWINVLARGVQTGEISKDSAIEGIKIISLGDLDWQNKNLKRFNKEVQKSNIRASYTVREKINAIKSVANHTDNPIKKERKYTFNIRQNILNDRLTRQLKQAGLKRKNDMIEAWENTPKDKRGRKPTKLHPFMVADILLSHTRFVVFNKNRNNDKYQVFMYLGDDVGIYTSSRALMNRYMRIVEPLMKMQDQSEAMNYLGDYVEFVNPTVDRHLIPVANGVFNLKTKELEPFKQDYVFTTKGETKYIEGAEKPEFKDGFDIDEWFFEIADGDEEIQHLLWQVINDSINGSYSRGRSIWLVGEGNNGKGTYQDLIRNIVGHDNVATLKIDQFDTSKNRFNTSMLEGKTVNIGDDVQAGIYIDNSSDFNSVVTGDSVTVEHKGKGAYSREFHLTIIQSTNDMPRIKNKTEGTYRRLLIVPFNADFNNRTENRNIKEVYMKDQQLLEYVLYKAINMDFEDFTIPEASKRMLKDYRKENNPIEEFKEERFDEVMRNLDKVPKQTAFDMYRYFCEQRGYKLTNFSNFKNTFEELIKNEYESRQAKYNLVGEPFTYYIPFSATHPKRGQVLQAYVKK